MKNKKANRKNRPSDKWKDGCLEKYDLEEAIQIIWEKDGILPGRPTLRRLTRCSDNRAKKALAKIKKLKAVG